MLREVFSRDTQKAMGQSYTRSRHYHLYLNGLYWGIYMTQERSEASYAESYFGGNKEDYDVIKHSESGIEATDGTTRAFRRLWRASREGFEDNEAYYRVQGMHPDGSRNPDYERMLDTSSLIDYMITAYFVGDRDGPGSRFTQPCPNNFYGIYNRENPDGFKWFMHDAEHSLGTGVTDLVNPLTIEHNNFNVRTRVSHYGQLRQVELVESCAIESFLGVILENLVDDFTHRLLRQVIEFAAVRYRVTVLSDRELALSDRVIGFRHCFLLVQSIAACCYITVDVPIK